MITEKDLQEAISECLGKRNPDAKTCIKLAAFLTIRRELYPDYSGDLPETETITQTPSYSFAPPPDNLIEYDSGTEFSARINGRAQADVWPIIEELIDSVELISPRLFKSFMGKLR